MFQFTTENLLNDLSRVSVVTQANDKAVPTNGTGIKIKSLNTFIVSHMSPVWKAVAVPAVKEVMALTVPTITAGTYRLSLSLRLAANISDADYARWDAYYGKPVDVEINLAGTDTVTTLAAKLNAWYNKYNAPATTKGLAVAQVGGKLQITAGNEFVRFQKNTVLEKYDATLDEYVPFSTLFEVTTKGNEGFGTTWSILKSLRIPTQEATYLTAENLDERPIASSLYNQYTFTYSVRRNINGMGAVGEEITSTTTHVLYVLQALASTFEGLLTGAGLTVSLVNAADTVTPVDDLIGADEDTTP